MNRCWNKQALTINKDDRCWKQKLLGFQNKAECMKWLKNKQKPTIFIKYLKKEDENEKQVFGEEDLDGFSPFFYACIHPWAKQSFLLLTQESFELIYSKWTGGQWQ